MSWAKWNDILFHHRYNRGLRALSLELWWYLKPSRFSGWLFCFTISPWRSLCFVRVLLLVMSRKSFSNSIAKFRARISPQTIKNSASLSPFRGKYLSGKNIGRISGVRNVRWLLTKEGEVEENCQANRWWDGVKLDFFKQPIFYFCQIAFPV